MVEVGIAEAQSMLMALLQQVEQGEEIVITREGSPLARITRDPALPRVFTEEEKARSQAAIERIGERRKTVTGPHFTWEEIKADRDFGKR